MHKVSDSGKSFAKGTGAEAACVHTSPSSLGGKKAYKYSIEMKAKIHYFIPLNLFSDRHWKAV
ncbi:hypothetical protein BWD07_06320 [Neisseria canis]|nr:hypothetical protein BWD07_06320 [Neisseria canis]